MKKAKWKDQEKTWQGKRSELTKSMDRKEKRKRSTGKMMIAKKEWQGQRGGY